MKWLKVVQYIIKHIGELMFIKMHFVITVCGVTGESWTVESRFKPAQTMQV